MPDFHKITIILSDLRLKQLAHFIILEQSTGNWMPDHLPAQDLAMTVCQGIKEDLDMAVMPHDADIMKILGKVMP